jgi:hypothetical protein
MIQLLNFFTVAEAPGGGGFYTPWASFPSDHQVAELWIDCKTFATGQVDVTLESSVDGDAIQTVSGPTSINAAGLTRSELTDKLAPMIRLKVQESGGATTAGMVISVWVIPKIGG